VLRVKDEDDLIMTLREQCALERELEAAKIQLSTKHDFNLYDAFNIFDVGRTGQITIHEIREGLNQIGVYPTAEEVELFMTRYDRTKDRRLTFAEFGESLLPNEPLHAKDLSRRPANNARNSMYRRDDCFLSDTQIEFRSLWRTHFKIELASETLRQRLASRPMFNIYEAFNSLDLNDDGRISLDEVRRLIESRGYFVPDQEINHLIGKMDLDKDGLVSYHEFKEEMQPKSPFQRA